MKQITKALVLAACLGLILSTARPHGAAALDTQNFIVNDFTADYYLDRNQAHTSTLHTDEKITATFPSYDQNHGILRSIPESYQGHTVSLKIDNVTDNNNSPINYKISHQDGNLVLKIGDADTYVHGTKVYKISYDQRNVALITSDDDEFYWDVNGDQWNQNFENVTAHIHVAPSLKSAMQSKTESRAVCFAGSAHYSQSARCRISQPQPEGNGLLVNSSAQNLVSGETLTVVAGFNKGTFKLGPEIAQEKHDKIVRDVLIGAAAIAPALLSAVFLFTRWWRYGRDPKGRGVIIPEYQPYKGLNVLTSDYVFLEKLDTKAISALIVELAVKKYLTINESVQKKRLAKDVTTYSLKLIKDPADLSIEENLVVKMFFKGGTAVGNVADLSALKSSMASDVKSLKKTLGTNLAAAGLFRSNPETAATKYITVATFLFIGGWFVITGLSPFIGAGVLLAAAVFAVFARYMPSRTDQGVEVRDHMLGLKDYIKLAEADRLKFLQSPQGAEKIQEAGLDPTSPTFRVKLFESLLPYAMVFGLEKNWAKQFEDIYKNPPDWYGGNWSTFNAFYLASALDNFASVNSVNFSPPSSSGSSGFGGGGFSGGGGGGGGGGGW